MNAFNKDGNTSLALENNLSLKLPAVSLSFTSSFNFDINCPLSKEASIFTKVSPVSFSSNNMVACTGDAPLNFGRSDGCRLIMPLGKKSITSFDNISP